MRYPFPPEAEAGRVREGPCATSRGMTSGAFRLRAPSGRPLTVIVSSGADWADSPLPGPPWEHVSVSVLLPNRPTPTWEEMCWAAALFFDDEETLVQYRPPKSDYRDFHKGCLHWFRCPGVEFPRPPGLTVAPKGA